MSIATLAPSAPTAALTAAEVRLEFDGGRDFLSACTAGLPPRATRAAVIADVEDASRGRINPPAASAAVEDARASFSRLVGTSSTRIAIGSQASVFAGLVASALPDNAEVLCAAGDFSSVVLPFVHAGRGIRVRVAPLAELASAITDTTHLVVFSVVQAATGEVADAPAIRAAAAKSGALTLCDATQAIGWLPVRADDYDVVICHAYKWLCSPRGVAFASLSERIQPHLRPLFAGWYAGGDPWASCYGHDVTLADDASRFDVSPAWQAFTGAAPALALFARADMDDIHAHCTGLAAAFRAQMGIAAPERPSAIVTWEDPDGADLARLTAAGITASGRAGRARVAFHVFNDQIDVSRAAAALAR